MQSSFINSTNSLLNQIFFQIAFKKISLPKFLSNLLKDSPMHQIIIQDENLFLVLKKVMKISLAVFQKYKSKTKLLKSKFLKVRF